MKRFDARLGGWVAAVVLPAESARLPMRPTLRAIADAPRGPTIDEPVAEGHQWGSLCVEEAEADALLAALLAAWSPTAVAPRRSWWRSLWP